MCSYLSHSISQGLDDLVVRCGDHALPVDLYDAVTDSNASSLCDPSSHQTADLQQVRFHSKKQLKHTVF